MPSQAKAPALHESGSQLSDLEIVERLAEPDLAKRIVVTPLISLDSQLGPSSLDLHLGTEFKVMDRSSNTHFDPLWEGYDYEHFRRHVRTIHRTEPGDYFVVHPKQFVLATTLEYIGIPRDLLGELDGRSTWARHGIQVHCTASIIHPGSSGIITYELQNMEDIPILLYPGLRLGQMTYCRLSSLPARPYGANSHSRAKFKGHVNPERGSAIADIEIGLLRAASRKSGRELAEGLRRSRFVDGRH